MRAKNYFSNILPIIVLQLLTISLVKGSLLSAEGYTFDDFVRQFNRNYASLAEKSMREQVFQQNYRNILDEESKANGTYHVTINNFTDWTTD